MFSESELGITSSVTFADRQRNYEPGLEVLQSEYEPVSVPQVHPHAADNHLHPVQPTVHHDEGKHWNDGNNPVMVRLTAPRSVGKHKKTTRKRKITILAIIITILIVAVVGSVVGTQVGRSEDGEMSPTHVSPAATPSDSSAAMTGGPTSVNPGLAPTAVSWGYPHLEVFSLTRNGTASVYRKWRNSNATSESDFTPPGTDMALVGGAVDTTVAPSIAATSGLYFDRGTLLNKTEIHIYGKNGQTGYYKLHNNQELWTPWVQQGPGDPDIWEALPQRKYLSAPSLVHYEKTLDMLKVFFISSSGKGAAVYYFQYYISGTPYRGPIQIYGPDLQEWAPAVVAWAGNDSRHDVFAVSRINNHLLHTYKEAGMEDWTDYEDLRGFVTVPPTVVSREPGRLDVFTRGGDGGLWHLAFGDGQWSSWQRIGGGGNRTTTARRIQGRPHAVSTGAGSIDVLAWGEAKGEMLHKTYDAVAQRWYPPPPGDDDDGDGGFTTLVASGLVGPPSAMVDDRGEVQVFAYNSQNQIIWQTIGPDKKAKGKAKTWADVPYNVA